MIIDTYTTYNENKIIYFLTLTKTFKPDYNRGRFALCRYRIAEKLICNGFTIKLHLDIGVTKDYIYQTKDIRINGKRSTVYELLRVLKNSCNIPLPSPISEIWF